MSYGEHHPKHEYFVYLDPRPLDQRFKIGQYIIDAFPHLTFGNFASCNPDALFSVIDSIAHHYDPIPLERGELFITNGDRRKIAVRYRDPTRQLHDIQAELFNTLGPKATMQIKRSRRYSNQYSPHVTFSRPEAVAPAVPAHLLVDSLVLAEKLPFSERPKRNIVSHVSELAKTALIEQ